MMTGAGVKAAKERIQKAFEVVRAPEETPLNPTEISIVEEQPKPMRALSERAAGHVEAAVLRVPARHDHKNIRYILTNVEESPEQLFARALKALGFEEKC